MQEESYQDLTRELWGTSSRWSSKRTYADLARELQVDEETARKRVRRLKESGYLMGWRLQV